MFNYSTHPKENNHYYQYLRGNNNDGLHINTQSLGIHFNHKEEEEQHHPTSPIPLPTCDEPSLSPTIGSPSSSTSSITTSPLLKNTTIPIQQHSPVIRRKSIITRKSNSNVTSPQVTCQSWDHLKSPAAMFLAGFASPTATTSSTMNMNNVSSTASSLSSSYFEEKEGDEIDDYVINEIIGYGGFSTVRKGYCISDGKTVAIKIIKKNHHGLVSPTLSPTSTTTTTSHQHDLHLEHELQIWEKMNHPYIVNIQKVLETDHANYIICDYCCNGTLLEKLQQHELTDQDKKRLFLQLVQAIQYIHQQCQVIHKDIKLDNVLLDDQMNVKLCDFGLAVHRQFTTSTPSHLSEIAHGHSHPHSFTSPITSPTLSPTNTTTNTTMTSSSNSSSNSSHCHSGVGGSLAYCAPEQLKSSKVLSCPKTDIWSLGIVLYAMFAGKLPFSDDYDVRLRQSILLGEYTIPTHFSSDLTDLISHCLDPNPMTRYSLNEIMNHSWLS
ncbi:unnamed protein product [Cunninghamella blakesleeana]